MATKEKDLPCVVLKNDEFRIVAKEKTKQAPSFHDLHAVVDLKDSADPDARDCVDLVAEQKELDSLGKESWSQVSLRVAVENIIASQVRAAMYQVQIQQASNKSNKKQDS